MTNAVLCDRMKGPREKGALLYNDSKPVKGDDYEH